MFLSRVAQWVALLPLILKVPDLNLTYCLCGVLSRFMVSSSKKNMQVEKLVKLYALSLLHTTNLTYTALGGVY